MHVLGSGANHATESSASFGAASARRPSFCSLETSRFFVVIVVLYLGGFASLTTLYIASVAQCARLQTETCINGLKELDQPCSDSATWTLALQYYEGAWAGVVLVVFTLLAFLFNGVVFAMCTCAAMCCCAVLCDVLQADGRARAVEAAADARTLRAAAQGMDRR